MSEIPFLGRFFPDEKVSTVDDIDYERLLDSGIKAVIFDLDNTIARWGEDRLAQDVIELLDCVTKLGLKVGILSNSRREKIEDFVVDLPFPHIFNANKPTGKGFREMLAELNVSPEEAAMIGDQMFTDVLGANRLDMYTIWVDPIDPGKEYSFTRINRVGEKIVLSFRKLYRSLKKIKEKTCFGKN